MITLVIAASHFALTSPNFAFISKVSLTEPVTNTREYGESIARIANVLGDSKPIIQTLRDLKEGRRSKWSRINKIIAQEEVGRNHQDKIQI